MNQSQGVVQQFSVDLTQYFGTAGSASVPTPIVLTSTLVSGTWHLFTGTAILPLINGKNVQPGNALYLNINLPLNVVCQIYIGPVILNQGTSIVGTQEISNDDMQKQTNATALYPAFTTGDIKLTLATIAETGWLVMNNGTIGNPSSGAGTAAFNTFELFSLLWTNVTSQTGGTNGGGTGFAQLYDSAGSPLASVTTLLADWNANKRIGLTKTLGRVLGGIGNNGVNTYTLGENAGLDSSTEVITHVHGAGSLEAIIPTFPAGAGTSQIAGTNSSPATDVTVGITGSTAAPAGAVSAMSIVQASVYYNVMIKL
jgi:hypothetical protein